jgi:hypothetical protein
MNKHLWKPTVVGALEGRVVLSGLGVFETGRSRIFISLNTAGEVRAHDRFAIEPVAANTSTISTVSPRNAASLKRGIDLAYWQFERAFMKTYRDPIRTPDSSTRQLRLTQAVVSLRNDLKAQAVRIPSSSRLLNTTLQTSVDKLVPDLEMPVSDHGRKINTWLRAAVSQIRRARIAAVATTVTVWRSSGGSGGLPVV